MALCNHPVFLIMYYGLQTDVHVMRVPYSVPEYLIVLFDFVSKKKYVNENNLGLLSNRFPLFSSLDFGRLFGRLVIDKPLNMFSFLKKTNYSYILGHLPPDQEPCPWAPDRQDGRPPGTRRPR